MVLQICDWFRGWNISATVVTQQRGTGYQDRMFRIHIAVGLSHGSANNNADVILWCNGFRSSLDQLAPLMLREAGGGITMTGRLATQKAKDPRIHLVGYGPSASTIGTNRAGAAAASELMAFLGLRRATCRS